MTVDRIAELSGLVADLKKVGNLDVSMSSDVHALCARAAEAIELLALTQSDAEHDVRRALEAIVIRCTEGDKRVDWLPTIERLAKEALTALAQSDAGRVKINIKQLEADGWRLPTNSADLESQSPAPAQSDAGQKPDMRIVLERCRTILANMALENEGGGIFTARWPIHHEPLRADAKNLLPLVDAALAQSDAEPRLIYRDPNCERIAAVRKAIKEAWLVDGEKTDFDADRLALAAIKALAQPDAEPHRDPDDTSANIVADPNTGSQSDAGPVAWQWQEKTTPEFGWAFCRNEEERFYLAQYPSKYNLRPLYIAPPRPDASGLIEAAEIAEEQANEWCVNDDIYFAFQEFAKQLRSRAADRSA